MTVDKTTRRVYSADELHRLRATCSQPKLREAIEEHEGEDAELVKGKFDTSCTTDITGKQTIHSWHHELACETCLEVHFSCLNVQLDWSHTSFFCLQPS